MELLIVRHAIARERNARRWPDDAARPLSPQGAGRARKAAAGLKALGPRPLRVLVSPLVRARETAAILTRHAGWPAASECPELAPGADPGALLAAIRHAGTTRVAVVGHEPDLGRLVGACLGGAPPQGWQLRKMGAALVTFAGTAQAGRGRLEWLVPARILRAAR
ncbi:MAG TPA: phosphohistidine phosphatase SixA [Steroidobacteraceae bacterium]|nr:phosphohistidine phosphatase SixA [Steroidobacteraceae bacterium]